MAESKCIELLSQLNDSDTTKAIQLLLKICSNILNHPTHYKYQDLNSLKVSNRFQQPNIFIDILIATGFQKSDNHRLKFNSNRIKSLEILNERIATFSELINAGYTAEEAKFAIIETVSQNKDSNTVSKALIFAQPMKYQAHIDALMKAGCSQREAVMMIKQNIDPNNQTCFDKMDLDDAVEYLHNVGFPLSQSMEAFRVKGYNNAQAFEYLFENYDNIEYKEKEQKPKAPKSVESLMNMGFSKTQAISALEDTDGNVSAAVDRLLNDSPNRGCKVQTCQYAAALVQALNAYDVSYGSDTDVLSLINSFNHSILHHNSEDDFEYIYKQLKKCLISECTVIKRHYRNRNVGNEEKHADTDAAHIFQIEDTAHISQIVDKIHCFYCHSYDIGYRLTMAEIQDLQSNDVKESKENNINSSHQKLKSLKQLLNSKKIFNKQTNKFYQLQPPHDEQVHKNYSFGQLYFYWSYYKNSHEIMATNPGYAKGAWYLEPKYANFKDELLNNNIARLVNEQFLNEYRKARLYHSSRTGKSLTADTESNLEYLAFNTRVCDIDMGTQITPKHLSAVMIYCGYTNIQYEFSKTYRKADPNESDFSLKQRHSEFYHLGRYITEAVVIFSKKASQHNIRTFYHGIGAEMVFDSMRFEMYQPFSTTISKEVAINFTNYEGMIIELNCGDSLNCFDCAWLSEFSNEKEMLFICGKLAFQFVNITHVKTSMEYELYVKGITIIDSVTSGLAFQNDTIQQKFVNNQEEINRKMVSRIRSAVESNTVDFTNVYLSIFRDLVGHKHIPPKLKYITIRLIKHQLGKSDSTYPKIENIPQYVDQLLHNICIKNKLCAIRWKQLIYEGTNYQHGGHQTYLFLQSLLCRMEYPMINLQLFSLLFPNLSMIYLEDMPTISKRSLEYVLNCISTNTLQYIKVITWCLAKQQFNPTLTELIATYKHQFNAIRFVIDQCKDDTYGIFIQHKSVKNAGDL
eukprot:357670_1